jgi:hypothetical protein
MWRSLWRGWQDAVGSEQRSKRQREARQDTLAVQAGIVGKHLVLAQ